VRRSRLSGKTLGEQGDMENALARVRATGGWTFEIGSEFELVDNGDSVQAIHGARVVYVSSRLVGSPDAPVRAEQIRSALAKGLGPGGRLSHAGQSVQGDAQVQRDTDTWRLRGTMCADGTVANCVIDFPGPEAQPWAVGVWRSLLHGGEVGLTPLAELAGFFAAHAVWCVCEGETLIPLAGYENADGRHVVRFEGERLEAGVESGRRWMMANPKAALRAVLVFDGYVPLPGGKTDALILEAREYGPSDMRMTIAVPYRHASSPSGFAVHRPKFLAVSGPGHADDVALGEALLCGAASHEKGAAVWNAHLDESR